MAVSILSIFPHPPPVTVRISASSSSSTSPPSPLLATFPGTMVLVVTVATHPRDKLENSPRWYCPARNRRAEQNRRAINIRTPWPIASTHHSLSPRSLYYADFSTLAVYRSDTRCFPTPSLSFFLFFSPLPFFLSFFLHRIRARNENEAGNLWSHVRGLGLRDCFFSTGRFLEERRVSSRRWS